MTSNWFETRHFVPSNDTYKMQAHTHIRVTRDDCHLYLNGTLSTLIVPKK